MDLNHLEPVNSAVFYQLRHPVSFAPMFSEDEEGKSIESEPIGFEIVGTDSEEYAKRQRFLTDDRFKRMERTIEAKGTIAGLVQLTAEEQETQNLHTIAACVKGLRNIVVDGEVVAYSHDNVVKLLTRFKWIREQVDRAIADRSNFIKPLSTK